MKADSFSESSRGEPIQGGTWPPEGDAAGCLGAELELCLEGELLDARSVERVRAHLAACPRCRRRADDYETLTRRILELAAPRPREVGRGDAAARGRVDRILHAVGELRDVARASRGPESSARLRRRAPAAAAEEGRSWKLRAAAILVIGALLGFGVGQLRRGADAPARVAASAVRPAGDSAEAVDRGDGGARVVWFAHWNPTETAEAVAGRLDERHGAVRLLGFPTAGGSLSARELSGASGLRWVVDALRRRPAHSRGTARYFLIPDPVRSAESGGLAREAGPTAGEILRADRTARARLLARSSMPELGPGAGRGVEIVPVSWVRVSESEAEPRAVWDEGAPPTPVRIWVVPQPAPRYVLDGALERGSSEGRDGVPWMREEYLDPVPLPLSPVPR